MNSFFFFSIDSNGNSIGNHVFKPLTVNRANIRRSPQIKSAQRRRSSQSQTARRHPVRWERIRRERESERIRWDARRNKASDRVMRYSVCTSLCRDQHYGIMYESANCAFVILNDSKNRRIFFGNVLHVSVFICISLGRNVVFLLETDVPFSPGNFIFVDVLDIKNVCESRVCFADTFDLST